MYTICVNIGSLDITVDGEINYPNANTDAYAPDTDVDEGEVKESYVGDSKCKDEEVSLGDKEGVAKDSVCMYGKSVSLGVEAMNRANEDTRQKTAVDILNATLILLKKESTRYNK